MAGNVLELTDATFQTEVLESQVPVLVDFWAPWCQPCKTLAPTIEKLATQLGDKVKVGKMDTDKNIEIPGQHGVSAIPTVIIFQNGKPVERLVGLNPEAKYKDALSRLGVAV
jgi:thioredoxin 1